MGGGSNSHDPKLLIPSKHITYNSELLYMYFVYMVVDDVGNICSIKEASLVYSFQLCLFKCPLKLLESEDA